MVKGVIFDLNRTVYDPETDGFTPGCEELLRDLKAMGYKLCLLGRSDDGRVDLICRLGLFEIFGRVLLVDEKKPEYFQECLDHMDLEASEVAVVGDRVDKEITIGNEMKMVTILYRRGKFADLLPANELQIPAFITSDMREVIKFLVPENSKNIE